MSAAWVTRLRRTIDNGSCTLAHIDGALRLKALTADEHTELVSYWHEVNDPPVEPEEPEVEPEAPVSDEGQVEPQP